MSMWEILFTAGLWASVLRIATPLIFGTLGALLCERVGVLNLGIEGIMTFGAMAGWLAVFNGADLWTGLAVAAICGGLFGALHAVLTVSLGLSQHVTGLGITLFASSFSYYLFRLVVPVQGTPPTIEPFGPAFPGLAGIPGIGPVLAAQTAPTWLAIGAVLVLAWVLARTPLGLALRMTGENPHAAEAQGLDPIALRYGAVICGSA
ncbi:MAG: ABC transporter permease, partial [Pseudooceanicola nanhaiensis]